jgi:hypothetical protein
MAQPMGSPDRLARVQTRSQITSSRSPETRREKSYVALKSAEAIQPRQAQRFLFHQVGSWAANEGISRLEEAQQPADLAGDADANTCANVRGPPNRGAKPKRPIGTQVNSVQPSVDLQCDRKSPRPSR